jgi:hypothetical protein
MSLPPPALQVLALQRGAGNAAVARMLAAETTSLQRRTERPEEPPAPQRVVSKTGAIVLVGPQELYATAEAIAGAATQLRDKGSFVSLAEGAPSAFDATLLRVVPRAVQPTDAKAPRLQSLYAAVNVRGAEARSKARLEKGTEQFNAERNAAANIATELAEERFKQDIDATLGDYATFSDCHRNTELVMGAETEQALIDTPEGDRAKLPSLPKAEARGFAQGSADPAALGAYAWLAAAIPSFPARVEAGLREAGIDPTTSVVWERCEGVVAAIRGSIVSKMSINDPNGRAAALANPDYPRELWRLYRLIMDTESASGVLAILYGVNQGLHVSVGDGLSVINDPYEKQAADVGMDAGRSRAKSAQGVLDNPDAQEAEKLTAQQDLTAAQADEAENTKWNFHWVPVIMTDDEDFVALEDAAGDDADVNRLDTYRWRFKMFGPEKTLHGESRADPHTTAHYLTLPFARADEEQGSALEAEKLAPVSTSTVAAHGALVNRAQRLSPPVITVTLKPKATAASKTLKVAPTVDYWKFGDLEREGRDAFVEALEQNENAGVLRALQEEVERREREAVAAEPQAAPSPSTAAPPPPPALVAAKGPPRWRAKAAAPSASTND